MKIKSLLFFYLFSLSSLALATKTLSTPPTTGESNDFNGVETSLAQESTATFHIDYQQTMIASIKSFCNQTEAVSILSQNGTHLLEYLRVGRELELDISSLYVAMRIFYNKMKACEIIDADVVVHILSQIPEHMSSYFEPDYEKRHFLERLERRVNTTLNSYFSTEVNLLTNDQESFIKGLSNQMSNDTFTELKDNPEDSTTEYTERLRQVLIRFIDNSLARTLWQPLAPESIWPATISIADSIYCMARKNIINHMDDVDDLMWSLVHRFAFFLDLYGSTLPESFYEDIESQIVNGEVFFLEVGEQDEGITTKKDSLLYALMCAKSKSVAFAKSGMFTDQQTFN